MSKIDLLPYADTNLEIGLLLAVLDDVTKEWTGELGRVADDVVVWQPFPQGHTIGALILHIADVEAYWIQQVGAGVERSPEEQQTLLSAQTDQYGVQWPVPPAKPLEWFLEQQRAVRDRTRATVLALGDPNHTGVRGEEEFALRWLLNHVISHEAYHGGQAVFLSLLHGHHVRQSPAPERICAKRTA